MQRNENESKYPLSLAIKDKTLVLSSIKCSNYLFEDSDVPGIISFLQQHPEITKLDLQCCSISDAGIKMLMTVNTLNSLALSYNYNENFTLAGIQSIAENTNLKTLILRKRIDDEGAKILAANQTLEHLNVAYGEINKKGAAYFAKNNTLKKLNLCYNKIGPAGAILLAKNTKLESLNISHNGIGNKGVYAFARNHCLKNLNMRHNELTDDIVHHFVKNDTLKVLDLGENYTLSDEGAIIIAQNKHLESLKLDGNAIKDRGVKALAKNCILKKLNLQGNRFTDKGGKALAENKYLKELEIPSNRIGDATAKIFALNTTLEKLDIAQTLVSDKGVIALTTQNKTLRNLEIGYSDKLTDKAFVAFKNNHNLHKLEIGSAYNISEQTKKIIKDRTDQNFRRSQQAWMKYALLISGINENKQSEIKNGIIPVMPIILEMAGNAKEETTTFNQSCDHFMHTLFFQNHIKNLDEIKHTPSQDFYVKKA